MTNNEIAAEMGYDAAYVSRILNDPRGMARRSEFREKVIEGMEDAGAKIQALASEAVNRAAKLMRQDEDKSVAARSAFGILDRAGYTKVERHVHAHVTMSDDRVDKMLVLAEKANEVGREYDYTDVEEVEAEILVDDKPGGNGGSEERKG